MSTGLGYSLRTLLPLLVPAIVVCTSLAEPVLPDGPWPGKPWSVKIYWENDAPYFKPIHSTDRWYTNGTAIVLAHRPDWAASLARFLPLADCLGPDMRSAFGYTAGHQMYSPQDITASGLQRNDHPYAGYLYGGAFLQRADDRTLEHFQVNLGVVGPAAQGRPIQRWVHRLTDDPEPQGWDHQLGDEVTIQFIARKKWRTGAVGLEMAGGALAFQALPQLGVQLGTVKRQMEADLTLRLGHRLPDDFGPGRLADVDSFVADPPDGWSGYGFLRLGGRAIEHDIFLDGNNFKDSHFVKKHPFVGELQAGVQLSYHTGRWALALGWSMTWTTEQFEQAPTGHGYGAWSLGLTCWF